MPGMSKVRCLMNHKAFQKVVCFRGGANCRDAWINYRDGIEQMMGLVYGVDAQAFVEAARNEAEPLKCLTQLTGYQPQLAAAIQDFIVTVSYLLDAEAKKILTGARRNSEVVDLEGWRRLEAK